MSTNMDAALRDISEALKFEHWLRFYFVKEEGDKLFLEVPQDRVDQIAEKHPALMGLVEMLNKTEIDYDSSCNAVCAFLGRAFDGSSYPTGTVSRVLDSGEAKLEMHLFSLWIQGHEGLLDSELMDFSRWMELFEEWKGAKEVQNYAANVLRNKSLEAPTSDALH